MSFIIRVLILCIILASSPAVFAQDTTYVWPNIANEGNPAGNLNCFDYYEFGSVQADLQSNLAQTVPGTELTFSGKIQNNNNYPLVDGTLSVKIFLRDESTFGNADGNPVVDQFTIEKDIILAPNEARDASFVWKVPTNAQGGEYYAAYFFTTSKRYNLLGLSFTDDVVGNQAFFTVVSDAKNTLAKLSKTDTTLNGQDHRFAAFPLQFNQGDTVTVKTTVTNPSDAPKSIPMQWNQYAWDSQNEDNLRNTKTEIVTLASGETKEVSYEVKMQPESIVYVTALTQDGESKSFLNVRYVKNGVEETRINFPSLTAFPLAKDTETTLFACAHSTNLPVVPGNTLTLALTDKNGESIHTYRYEGDITGAMAGFGESFIPTKNYNQATLTATLERNGVTVEQVKIAYDCNKIDANTCLPEEEETLSLFDTLKKHGMTIILILGVLLLLGAIGVFFHRRRGEHIVAMFMFVVVLPLMLFVPHSSEAKSVTWSGSAPTLIGAREDYGLFCISNCNNFDMDMWVTVSPKVIPLGQVQTSAISVLYSSSVRNNTTAQIFDDGSVTVGDSISFIPKAAAGSDISWVGTGHWGDSPNGFWGGAGANCTPEYYVGTTYLPGASVADYVAFRVTPAGSPAIVKTGTAGLTCDAGGFNCTVTSPGTIQATITWPQASGRFYYAGNKTGIVNPMHQDWHDQGCNGANSALFSQAVAAANGCSFNPTSAARGECLLSQPPHVVNVSSQSIQHNLTVAPPANTAPSAPVIAGPVTGTETTPYTFQFTSSDPDGDSLRYAVDWNNDSVADALLPGAGYVGSGVMQSANYSWSYTGTFTFRARAQDSAGNISGWTLHTIDIMSTPPAAYTVDRGCGATQVWVGMNCMAGEELRVDCAATERGWERPTDTTMSCPMNPFSYTSRRGICIADATCGVPVANLTINGSPGPISVTKNSPLSISWNTAFVPSCTKFGANWGSGQGIALTGNETVLATVSDTYLINCNGTIDSVVVTVVNQAPNAPTITHPSGSAPYGTNTTFTITGTDPDNDTIYYQVDWDNNGTVDATTMSVPSGTSQAAVRSWTTPGNQTFQARTVDSVGAVSSWTSHVINIQLPPAATATLEAQIDGGSWSSANQSVSPLSSINIRWSSTNATSCSGSGAGFNTSNNTSGTDGVTTPAPTASDTFVVTCSGVGGSGSVSITITSLQSPNFTTPLISHNPQGFNPVTGTYDALEVIFQTSNNGGINTSASANYQFQFDRGANGYDVTTSGSLGLLNVGASVNRTETVSGVPLGNNRIAVTVDSTNAVVEANEGDNTNSLDIVIPPPDPGLSITANRTQVRSGETVILSWIVGVPYPMNCRVFGPGIATYTFDPSISGGSAGSPRTTGAITAKSEYTLSCTEPITNTTFTDSVIIEAQGKLEEI